MLVGFRCRRQRTHFLVSLWNINFLWHVWPYVTTCGKCDKWDHMWQMWPHIKSVTTYEKCDHIWQVWSQFGHLDIMDIWTSLIFEYHGYLDIMDIWISWIIGHLYPLTFEALQDAGFWGHFLLVYILLPTHLIKTWIYPLLCWWKLYRDWLKLVHQVWWILLLHYFCPSLPAVFTQPGAYLSAEPWTLFPVFARDHNALRVSARAEQQLKLPINVRLRFKIYPTA